MSALAATSTAVAIAFQLMLSTELSPNSSNSEFNMRMISEDSLLTIVRVSRSHNTGTVARPVKSGRAAWTPACSHYQSRTRISSRFPSFAKNSSS